MVGVNYLASNQVVTEWTVNMTVFWIILAIIFIIFLIAGIIVAIQEDNIIPCIVFVAIGVFIGAFLGVFGAELTRAPAQHEIHHQVTITDDANIQEFLDKYEVVEQNGKIFTIREKNNREKP